MCIRLRQRLQCVKSLSCWCCNLGAGKDSRVSSLSMSSWIENQGTRSFLVLLVTLGCLKSEIEELLRALQCVLSSGGMCFPGKPCSLLLGCPAGSRARILCSLEVWKECRSCYVGICCCWAKLLQLVYSWGSIPALWDQKSCFYLEQCNFFPFGFLWLGELGGKRDLMCCRWALLVWNSPASPGHSMALPGHSMASCLFPGSPVLQPGVTL